MWNVVNLAFFRYTPIPLHRWRAFVLRSFGAKVGERCHIYPKVAIWAPWNLSIGEAVGIANGVTLYSMDKIVIGDYAVVSQEAYLCCGSHNIEDSRFTLTTRPIEIGKYAWVCARAFLHPGTRVQEGTVIAACATLKGQTQAWAIYAGNPATQVGERGMAIKDERNE